MYHFVGAVQGSFSLAMESKLPVLPDAVQDYSDTSEIAQGLYHVETYFPPDLCDGVCADVRDAQ